MCVRYALNEPTKAIDQLSEQLAAKLSAAEWQKPRYNIALTQIAPVIISENSSIVLKGMRWGFTGKAQSLKTSSVLANARSETVTELPTFKEAIVFTRCIIPANGFYEFQDLGKRKQPYLFTLKDDSAMALAGVWQKKDVDTHAQFCLLTTEPNALVRSVHDRMPVILNPDAAKHWLNGEALNQADMKRLTQSYNPDKMSARRLSTYVNNVRNEGPECMADEIVLPELF